MFTGLGTIGAIGLGVAVHGDSVTPGRLLGLALIVTGLIIAHITAPAS